VAGRDVPPPKRTKSVAPAYPAAAQAVGQRGIVIVQLLVGPDGKVVSADIVRSVPPFDEAALVAVRQWEYEPTKVDGQPVSVSLTIPITFAMRLPEVAREAGVPEMRQGVSPAFPGGAQSQEPQKVKAELSIEPSGQVKEASVIEGNPPYTEAVMQALRTWGFVPPANGKVTTVTLEAVFSGGKEGARVQLRLYGARSADAPATAAATPPPATPGPPPATPTASASRPPVTPVPLPAPVTELPAPRPPAAVSGPAPRATAVADARPSARATAPAAPAPAAPQVEIVPGAPPPRPTDSTRMEAGVSAVRDVTLNDGVPDLTAGRRPQVPPLARIEGVTGQIEVRFVVEASGATSNLEMAGPELLREAARQTVGSWTFRRGSTERLFLFATIEYGPELARALVKRLSSSS